MANDINDNENTHKKYADAYTQILKTYESRISSSIDKKNELKEKFFKMIRIIMYILTGLFVASIIGSLVLFGIMIGLEHQSVAVITGAITTIISSFVTMMLSIFKLPTIIAKYLFNKKEDELMNEIIKNIQQYEIKSAEIEKIKQFSIAEAIVANANIDTNLDTSGYNIPSQSVNNSSNESQTDINDNVS